MHKMKLKFFFWYLEKKLFNLNWIYLHKIFITKYSIPYTRGSAFIERSRSWGWKVKLLWIFLMVHENKKYLKGTCYSLVNLLYSNLSCNYYCSLPTTIRYVTTTQCCEICRDQSLFIKVLLWAVFMQQNLRFGL